MATVGVNVFQFAQPSDFDSIEEYTRHELERALDYIQARQQSSNTQLDSSINEIKELRDEVETLRGADPVGATITLEQVRALVATAIGQIKSPVGSTHPEWDEIRNKPYILTYDQILKLNDIQANSDVTGERNVRRALTNLKRDITLNGRKIRFVGTPQNSDDVANKRYVDELSGQPTEHGVRIAADKLSSELRVNRQRITDLATPKNNNDAATKKYVDDQVIANPIIPVPVITDQTISLKIPSGTFGTLNITATGIGLSYQWYTGASGNTTSSIAGAVSDQYATPVLTANTNYWCRVTNVTGSVDSVTITITVTIAVPVITAQSDNSSVTTGDNITLSVTVTGTGLSYQWYKGVSGSTASLISGATARSYTTGALTIGLSRFWCRVTNAGGTADSTTITITASIAAPIITTQPSGGTITTGQTLDLTVVASGTGLSYQWYTGNSGSLASPIAGATNSSYNTGILSGGSHKFWVRVTNSAATADSNTATVAVDLILPVIRTQPVGGTFQISQSSAIRISVSVIGSGLSYQWYIGNSGATTSPIAGATSSSYSPGTLSDGNYSYWVRITNSDGSIDSNQADILVTFNLPVITTQPVGGTFRTNDSISLSVTASGNRLSYQWYTGVSGVTTSLILGATLAAYSFGTLSAGSYNYWVRVSNTGGSVDSDTASFSIGILAPVIRSQSTNFNDKVGNSSLVSVVASGLSLTYQWYTGLSGVTTGPISGAISSSYSTGSLTHGTKNYWVRVSNTGGSVDSTTITITVTYRSPAIDTQPTGGTFKTNQAITLAVVATGDSLSYQWYTGVSGDVSILTIIPGATSATYSIGTISVGTYYFWVRISNSGGSIDSNTANLIINQATTTVEHSFDSSGTWTKPNGFISATVEIWTGGSGGIGLSLGSGGIAGNGGNYGKVAVQDSDLENSISVLVGGRGTGKRSNESGSRQGGDSRFGVYSIPASYTSPLSIPSNIDSFGRGGYASNLPELKAGGRGGSGGRYNSSSSSSLRVGRDGQQGGNSGGAGGSGGTRAGRGNGDAGSSLGGGGGGGGGVGGTGNSSNRTGHSGGNGGNVGGGGGGPGGARPGTVTQRGGNGGSGYVYILSTVTI